MVWDKYNHNMYQQSTQHNKGLQKWRHFQMHFMKENIWIDINIIQVYELRTYFRVH